MQIDGWTLDGYHWRGPNGERLAVISGGTGVETALIIAAVVAVAAAGVGAYATYQQGQDQKKAAKYNAKLAENQAIASRQNAEVQADRLRARTDVLRAEARARAAASGVEFAGSPLLVIADNAKNAELEAQRIKYGGDVAASAFEGQAGLHRFSAGAYERAGTLGAGATLLSGLSGATRMYAGGYTA